MIGNNLLGNAWNVFRSAMRDAHATFSQKTIEWVRQEVRIDRYGEDMPNSTETVLLQVLVDYNWRRTWPVTMATEMGDQDEQTCMIYFNKEYLSSLGYLNAEGYFLYNPDIDRFIIDGLTYKPFGDTAAAQMYTEDVHILIIVKRVKTSTGDIR